MAAGADPGHRLLVRDDQALVQGQDDRLIFGRAPRAAAAKLTLPGSERQNGPMLRRRRASSSWPRPRRSRSRRVARADEPVPLVHPLYVHLPDAPEEDALRRAFTAAAARYKLHPVEVVDVPAPPAPRAPELLKTGIINAQKIAFGEALRDLDAAAAEVGDHGRRRAVDRRAGRPLSASRDRDRPRGLERDRRRAARPRRARTRTPTTCAPRRWRRRAR